MKLVAITVEEIRMIRELGQTYLPALLPVDIERGELGKCFDTCIMAALRNPKYRYVEGMAKSHRDKEWKLHAWLTDGIHAFDPTWACIDNKTGKSKVFPGQYIGIEMDTKAVATFMSRTEYQGVIANWWRDPFYANKAVRSLL